MSKSRSIQRAATQHDGRVLRITSRGVLVECMPITIQLEQIANQIPYPDPPTYVEYSGLPGQSDEVRVPYTQEVIDSLGDKVPEEDRRAWEEYLNRRTEVDRRRNELTMRLLAVDGVRIVDEGLEDEWEKKARWFGYTVPEDKWERQYFFFTNFVIGTLQDVVAITAGIYEASGVAKEVVDRMEELFRDKMGRAERDAIGADTATA